MNATRDHNPGHFQSSDPRRKAIRKPKGMLKVREDRILASVMSTASYVDAAKACNLSRFTIREVMNRPHVQAEYERRRMEVMQGISSAARLGGAEGIAALREVANDRDAPPMARVVAGKALVDLAVKASELEDLLGRLDRIEKAQAVVPALGWAAGARDGLEALDVTRSSAEPGGLPDAP